MFFRSVCGIKWNSVAEALRLLVSKDRKTHALEQFFVILEPNIAEMGSQRTASGRFDAEW